MCKFLFVWRECCDLFFAVLLGLLVGEVALLLLHPLGKTHYSLIIIFHFRMFILNINISLSRSPYLYIEQA